MLMLITARELMLDRKVMRNAVMVAGISMSIMSMSLENRLVMRPIGVESKKCSGDRSTLTSMD